MEHERRSQCVPYVSKKGICHYEQGSDGRETGNRAVEILPSFIREHYFPAVI